MLVTIVILTKSHKFLEEFVNLNKKIFEEYPIIVVDKSGGEILKEYALIYLKKDLDLYNSRKEGISLVKTKYTMNLDSDIVVPEGFIEGAIKILEERPKIGAVVALQQDTDKDGITHRGVFPFGISIWRTNLLQELYDFNIKIREKEFRKYCECLYMWEKLNDKGYGIEVIGRAIHLKGGKNDS